MRVYWIFFCDGMNAMRLEKTKNIGKIEPKKFNFSLDNKYDTNTKNKTDKRLLGSSKVDAEQRS